MTDAIESWIDADPEAGIAAAFVGSGRAQFRCAGSFAGDAVTPHTVWPVASLSKPVFAYGVLLLAQAGLLELDESLTPWLPDDVRHADPTGGFTARRALAHTTGLPNWRGPDGLSALYPPGERFSYSTEGLYGLQQALERRLGQPVAKLLDQKVFAPLGMRQSALVAETAETISPALAFTLNAQPAIAGLSLRTSAADYARFLAAQWNDGEPGHLRGQWQRTMLAPQVRVADRDSLWWGLGWGLQVTADGPASFWHWGARGIPRVMSFAVGWPAQRRGAVVMTSHPDGLVLCREVLREAFPDNPLPAFDWLLPLQHWRADGLRPAT